MAHFIPNLPWKGLDPQKDTPNHRSVSRSVVAVPFGVLFVTQ